MQFRLLRCISTGPSEAPTPDASEEVSIFPHLLPMSGDLGRGCVVPYPRRRDASKAKGAKKDGAE